MNPNYRILIVEDEENDSHLVEMAFRRNSITNPIRRVRDGAAALNYLRGDGEYADRNSHPLPDVLILDLKTPRMSGGELLAWIKDHPEHRIIPTIVLSGSPLDADVAQAYELGANTYFVKPLDFQELVELIKDVHDYWLKAAKPRPAKRSA